MSQIRELYIRVKQKDGPEVYFTDENNAFIAGFAEVKSTSHHILCIWHINEMLWLVQQNLSRIQIKSKPEWVFGTLFVKPQHEQSMIKYVKNFK